MHPTQLVKEFLSGLNLKATGRWFLLAGAIGVVSGVGAVAFQFLLQLVLHHALGGVAGYYPPEAAGEPSWWGPPATDSFSPWLVVAVMAAGGLLSGWIVYTFAPEAEGHGTDAAIDAFHHKRGVVRPRIPVVKTIASAITIGTGGSGGREGPIAQIGAGFGSFLATRLKLSPRERRLMVTAGMAGGIGAIFRAPLAGALFSAEILYKGAEFESDAIVPSAISSIVAYSVYCLSLPAEYRFAPLFGEGLTFAHHSPRELLPLALVSVLLVAAGVLYIKTFYGVNALFKRLPLKPHLRPALGALLAGLVAAGLWRWAGEGADRRVLAVLATGYGAIQEALSEALTDPEGLTFGLLLAVALGKILTTSLTIGSGGSGGVFGPSMVIGGCLGGAAGKFFHTFWPDLVPEPQAFVIVGMAGFFAGCAHAPISTIIMVSELTGDYKLLIPTMWVSTLCFLLCWRWTLYRSQVPSRLESPAHRGDFIVDLLQGLKVQDVFRPGRRLELVHESTPLARLVRMLAESQQTYFPVVNASGALVGIFTADDVRAFIYDETLWRVAIARDIMVTDLLTVSPEDDLNTALRRFTQKNIDELPVVAVEDPRRLLGMLRRKDAIAFYNQRREESVREHSETAPAGTP